MGLKTHFLMPSKVFTEIVIMYKYTYLNKASGWGIVCDHLPLNILRLVKAENALSLDWVRNTLVGKFGLQKLFQQEGLETTWPAAGGAVSMPQN